MPSSSTNPLAPPAASPAGRPRLLTIILIAVASDALVIILYLWLTTVGTWTHWPGGWQVYDALAASFRHGQLALAEKPDPALLALPDPYDPVARADIPYPRDLSLFEGRFYAYFGPVPALILL